MEWIFNFEHHAHVHKKKQVRVYELGPSKIVQLRLHVLLLEVSPSLQNK